MKKAVIIFFAILCANISHTQFVETFESNKLGWMEKVDEDGRAIITEGVMRLEGFNAIDNMWSIYGASSILTSCYAPIDPQKNFTINCKAIANRINDKGYFGIIFNYMDDFNYSAFYICKGDINAVVVYHRVVDNELVGCKYADLKLTSTRKAEFNFSLKSSYDSIEFYCNNMKAMEIRYNPVQYCGIGFMVYGRQIVDFDDVEFIQ